MGDAIALQRMKAFVIEKGLDKGMAGGIAVEHRRQIGADRLADAGIGRQRFLEGFARQQADRGPRRPACAPDDRKARFPAGHA